jgi:hypothetical protein
MRNNLLNARKMQEEMLEKMQEEMQEGIQEGMQEMQEMQELQEIREMLERVRIEKELANEKLLLNDKKIELNNKKLELENVEKSVNILEKKLEKMYNPDESLYIQCRKGYIKRFLKSNPINLETDKHKSEELLRAAATWGILDIVQQCIKANVDPSTNEHEALRESCRHNHHKVVHALLDTGQTWDFNEHAMWCAKQNKDKTMITILETKKYL